MRTRTLTNGWALALGMMASSAGWCAQMVPQSERRVPVVYDVDVVVAGGSVGAVSAALAAAEAGCTVFLATSRPYLGEDMCATLRLWLDEGEQPDGALTRKIFPRGRLTTPMRVKRTLSQALLDAGATFLLGCYVTDVLEGPGGGLAGIVIANRAGRQAVTAKVIVDATEGAEVARMAGARGRPWPDGTHTFTRVVLGPKAAASGGNVRLIPFTGRGKLKDLYYHEHTLKLRAAGQDFASLAEAEQKARDATYREGQLRTAERLHFIAPDPIVCRAAADRWRGIDEARIEHFMPDGVAGVYVLSDAADVPRTDAEKLMRPGAYEKVGRFVGTHAARQASRLPRPAGARVRVATPTTQPAGDVREVLNGLRPTDEPRRTVVSPSSGVPVLGRYDVVVVGGGTTGAPAAIGAARQGATVLVVEYQEGLGGVGTLGLIGRPYHGRNVGFSREVPFPTGGRTVDDKMEWFRREIRKAGGHIWFGALGCGAYVERKRLKGAVVATPRGRGVVLATVVIDATGNADVAVSAGADYMFGGDDEAIALQGTGLPVRPLGSSYVNTDYLLVDESDVVDVWRALVGASAAMDSNAFDFGTLIQSRERRRVVGDHVLSYLDQIAGRTFPDTIVYSASDYDSHGYPTHPYFALIPHDERTRKMNHPAPSGSCYTPYRCLLPRGLDRMLVVGLGISMHRDASAMVRMQHDLHNQGYAAGVAAAMAAEADRSTRAVDVKALQRHLVEIGNLPASVLTHTDSFPLPQAKVAEAVRALRGKRDAAARGLAVILSHRQGAAPLLRTAFSEASGEAKLTYARVLGFLGDRTVVPTLVAALNDVAEWDEKIFQGRMAEYAHLPTPVDALVLALGYAGDRRAAPAIVKKLDLLDARATLSHHRAVALALERIGDRSAAAPLARLLSKPGMRGHAMTKLEPLHDGNRDRRRRTGPLREIVLARALYRCGDHRGLGEQILKEYRHDLRGLFARHAAAVLGKGP